MNDSGSEIEASGHHGTAPGNGSKVVNVLSHLSREQLIADVDAFVVEKGLDEHRDVIRKGAILAQQPHHFESMDVLDEEDRAAVRYEYAHKWSHPKTLYVTVFLCSIGAATQGWDQTGSNGANLSFPTEFGIGSTSEKDQWLVGLVNSAPYIGSAFIGCWLSDPLNNWFGRRGVIFLTALILLATPIASAFTHSWETLFIVRMILGVGMGAKGSTVPIFAAENSPPLIRGALVMGWQLWTAFGIFLGTAANVIVANFNEAWRYQLGSAFIPAVPLLAVYLCPESPRWLIKKNRYPQAYKSLLRLRFTPLQAARDLYYIHAQVMEEKKIIKGETYIQRVKELFVIPRVRRATVAATVVMLAQQMCGINVIAFYSSTVFVLAGFTPYRALFVSLGFGATNFLFAIPALFTIDTYGRRALLLFTFPNMFWTLLVAGLSFLIKDDQTRLAMVASFIFIFVAFYSVGEGPVPFAYSAEVFPLAQREMGMAWSVATCLFWAAVLSMSFPRIEGAFGFTGAFGFYAGLNVLAFFLILCFLPETKQLSLEELDQVFSIPTKVHISHTFNKAAPYWFKRWIFWRRDVHLDPIIALDEDDYVPENLRSDKKDIAVHEEEKRRF